MVISEFVEGIKNAKVINNRVNPNAMSEYLNKVLDVKTYLPFAIKKSMAQAIVDQNTEEIDGVLKNDSINQYLCFVITMIESHTALEFGDNPMTDYDLLAENKLLEPIIEMFRSDYDECDVLLKMALASKLEANNLGAVVGRFLNGILDKIDDFSDAMKSSMEGLDLQEYMTEENMEKLNSFLDKMQ